MTINRNGVSLHRHSALRPIPVDAEYYEPDLFAPEAKDFFVTLGPRPASPADVKSFELVEARSGISSILSSSYIVDAAFSF